MKSTSIFLKISFIIFILISLKSILFCQLSANYISIHGISNHNLYEGSVLISNDKLGNTIQAGVYGGPFSSIVKLDDKILDGNGYVSGYISKLNPDNKVAWALNIDGNEQLIFNFLEVDTKGNIFLCGSFRGNVDFNPDPVATKYVSGSTTNITNFILKLDQNGKFIWVTTFGGISWNSEGEAFKLDRDDNIIIAGTFLNTFYYGSFKMSTPNQLLYCIKVNNLNGNLEWAKKYVDTYSEFNMDISIDMSNNIFILSQFTHTIDIDLGPPTKYVGAQGKNDIYIVKLSTKGDYLSFKNLKIAEEQQAKILMHDNEDNIIVIYKSILANSSNKFEHRIEKYSKDLSSLKWSKGLKDINIIDGILNKYYDIVFVGDFGGTTSYNPSTNKYSVIGDGKAFVNKISKNGISLSEKILNTNGAIKPYHIQYSTPNQITVAGFCLGKTYFDPLDPNKFVSADNNIENFTFRWQDQCGPLYTKTETLNKCTPFLYIDSLISQSGFYNFNSGNEFGCLLENKLTATVSNLDASIIATENYIFTPEKNATQYLWYNCEDLNQAEATTINTYYPPKPGQYTLIAKDSYCSDTSEICVDFPKTSLMSEIENKDFGKIVKLSKSGFGFIAYNEANLNGKIDVYKVTEDAKWKLIQSIKSPNGFNKSFGYEISSHNDLLLISEINETENIGRCYLYKNVNGIFSYINMLKSSNENSQQNFGFKTAIYNENIVISSPADTKRYQATQSNVFVYKYINNELQLLHQISNPDSNNDLSFGIEIAISENHLFISNPEAKIGNYTPGLIYIFKILNNSNTILLSDRLINLKGIKNFGKTIACSNQFLCIAGDSQYSIYKSSSDFWLFDHIKDVKKVINDLSLFEDKLVYSYNDINSTVIMYDLTKGISQNISMNNTSVPLNNYKLFVDIDSQFIIIGIPELDIFQTKNGLVYINQFGSTTSLENLEKESLSFSIFPNPAHEYISVDIPESNVLGASVIDITGKVLITTDQTKIDINNLSAGLYFLRLNLIANKSITSKFVKI